MVRLALHECNSNAKMERSAFTALSMSRWPVSSSTTRILGVVPGGIAGTAASGPTCVMTFGDTLAALDTMTGDFATGSLTSEELIMDDLRAVVVGNARVSAWFFCPGNPLIGHRAFHNRWKRNPSGLSL